MKSSIIIFFLKMSLSCLFHHVCAGHQSGFSAVPASGHFHISLNSSVTHVYKILMVDYWPMQKWGDQGIAGCGHWIIVCSVMPYELGNFCLTHVWKMQQVPTIPDILTCSGNIELQYPLNCINLLVTAVMYHTLLIYIFFLFVLVFEGWYHVFQLQ